MRAACPTDSTHTRFRTVAHVAEEWIVDADGDFLEVMPPDGSSGEVVHGPDPGNIWECLECGADASVTP